MKTICVWSFWWVNIIITHVNLPLFNFFKILCNYSFKYLRNKVKRLKTYAPLCKIYSISNFATFCMIICVPYKVCKFPVLCRKCAIKIFYIYIMILFNSYCVFKICDVITCFWVTCCNKQPSGFSHKSKGKTECNIKHHSEFHQSTLRLTACLNIIPFYKESWCVPVKGMFQHSSVDK